MGYRKKRDELNAAYHEKLEENEKAAEEKTAKKREKRQKKKAKKKKGKVEQKKQIESEESDSDSDEDEKEGSKETKKPADAVSPNKTTTPVPTSRQDDPLMKDPPKKAPLIIQY